MVTKTASERALPDPEIEPTITIPRAAKILGIGPVNAYAAAKRGEIPVIKVGKSVRVLTREFLKQYGLTKGRR